MQKSVPGKKKPKIVTKPMLYGRAADQMTFRRALRVAGSVLVAVFIYLVFGSLLIFDNLILRLLANTALILMCGGFLYMSGASHGEADAAFGEIMYQREAEGKTITDSDRARCFAPAKGVCTALLGALPFVLLCLIAALTAQLQTYALGALPEWLSPYRQQAEIGDALRYYESTVSFGVLDFVNLAVRLIILPFITIAGSGNAQNVLLVERLSPILALIVPAGYALGYLRGKELRTRVHTSIAQSRRRKKNKDKKERQRRQQKGPEQLI
jgi:hypothetical protein